MRSAALSALLLLAVACRDDPREQRARLAEARPALLKDLRARLDRLAATTADKPVDLSDGDLGPLVGMRRDELRAALGAPGVCREADPSPRGSPHHDGPCVRQNDWLYSFSYLPKGWRGGGSMLALRFNDDDETAKAWGAEWVSGGK